MTRVILITGENREKKRIELMDSIDGTVHVAYSDNPLVVNSEIAYSSVDVLIIMSRTITPNSLEVDVEYYPETKEMFDFFSTSTLNIEYSYN
jgi:hypothetical protein